jgi:hypothetical protein
MDNIQYKIEQLREQIEQLETIRHKQEQEKIACALANDTTHGIHFQNIRNELFKRQFGFWKKAQDNHYNIEREAWNRKYASYDEFDLHYVSSYPDEILSSLDNPPSFANTLEQGGSNWIKHYRDNRNGNQITYHFITNKNHPNPHAGPNSQQCTITSPSQNTPVNDNTLAAILFLLDDLSTRVTNLEST